MGMAPAPAIPRAIVYVDGFNLYNGLAKPLDCKWVNLQVLFERILSQNEVVAVNFFTSLVVGPTASNQSIYLKALRASPKVDIHMGRFQVRPVKCGVHACPAVGPREFGRPVEKRTDVAIASRMIEDAVEDHCDQIVLVSGDSDFVPAIETIRRLKPQISIVGYIPTLGSDHARLVAEIDGRKTSNVPYATELRNACHRHNDLPVVAFLRSQLPNPLVIDGEELRMPASWNLAPPRTYQTMMEDLNMRAAEARRRRRR